MNRDDNAVLNGRLNALWRAFRILFSACGELFLPTEPKMITDQKKDSLSDYNGEKRKNDYGWVSAEPPYYSGKFNVWSSGLTILGSGLFGSSFGMLQSDQWGWTFPGMFFGGIAFVALGWILMGVHTKCETIKFAKVKDDDLRKDRITRYCKRYKKSAKHHRDQHRLVDSYQWQALADARPQFLNSSDEFSEACTLLGETRFPPNVSHNEIKLGLWRFLIDANFVREDLLNTKGTWKVAMWANGASYYKEFPNGVTRLADRTEEEITQWRKLNGIKSLEEKEERQTPKEGEISFGEKSLPVNP